MKKQRHYFVNKGPSGQGYGFSIGPVWMWGELDYEESWAPKNWCFWNLVLEKTLESHLDCKEIQPICPKGNQSGIFIGRTDAEAEAQYSGQLIWRNDSLEKSLILRKTEGGRRRGQQRMRWLDDITDSMDMSEQTSGVGDGRGSLVCCSPWGHKVRIDWATELNWTELMLYARFPELNHLIKTHSSPLTNIYPFCLMVIFDCFLLVGWFFHLLNIYWVWAGKQADTGPNPQELCGFCFCFLMYYLFIYGCAESSLLLWLFSSCRGQGLLSSCGGWASHCLASLAVEHRF